jgi:HEAT repeat protein
LGDIGPTAHSALPVLIETFHDEEPCVRLAAAIAVGKIGIKGIPFLRLALVDTDPSRRQLAAIAARQMGCQARPLLPMLHHLAKVDPDQHVREAVIQALLDIER